MARVSSFSRRFLLSEVDDYSAINVPLKTAGRIKYTCFDVSHSFLVFGATSGGLYIFKREPCTFIQLLPNKEGPITLVSISPDEKLFAFASQRGIVCVLERTEGVSTRLLNRSTEHSGTKVTALQWANTSDQIFIGDSNGRLSVINVSLFMSKNIFHIPSFIFMQLDSGVVQISCRDDRLLISTLTHCYVCDTAKEQYRQIGTKPRDGEYGACYLNDKIFCARPGSRLWEVDLEGTVQSTHQFKQLLAAKPVLVVTDRGLVNNINYDDDYQWPEQYFNFVKLLPLLKFLFTFKSDGIYIFDPEKVDVVLWSNHFKDILDVKCLDDRIYIWTESKMLHVLTIITLDKCLLRLYFREKYNVCSDLLIYFSKDLLESKEYLFKLNPLIELKKCVDCNDDILRLLSEIEIASSQKEKATRLESGIFMLDNHHVCQKLLLENKRDYNLINSSSEENQSLQNSFSKLKDQSDVSSSKTPLLLPELIQSSGPMDLNGGSGCDSTSGLHNIPQIPFLPMSSPDLIHDALLEIGCNVSDKLVNGTRTLKDKWQVLEGKLKFSTKTDSCNVPFDLRSNINNKENILNGDIVNDLNEGSREEETIEDLNYDEEPVVANKSSRVKKLRYQKFIASDLMSLSSQLDKLDHDKRTLMLNSLILTVLNSYKQYNDFIIRNSSVSASTNSIATDMKNIKYFPFNQLLPDNYVTVIKNMFHQSLRSNNLIKWLNTNQNQQILKNIISDHSLKKYHPKILINAYPSKILLIDSLLSEILVIFSELLDPYSVLQSLISVDLPCTYLSWCSIMDRFQEGALRYFTKKNSDNNNDNSTVSDDDLNVGCKEWPMPLLLNAMFLLLRLDQVEPAVKMGVDGEISLSIVSYILLKLSSHLHESGLNEYDADKKCANLFLLYISKIITNSSIDYDNKGLISHIEESFVIVNKDLNYSICQCGFPKMNVANRTSSPIYNNVKFTNIAEILLNYFWDSRVKPDLLSHMSTSANNEQNDENFWSLLGNMDLDHVRGTESLEHAKRICSVAPPLLLWLLKNKINHDLFTVRTILILQLGYLHELDSGNINSMDKWEQIVGLNCRIERGECCFCNRKYDPVPGINWSHLAVLILKTIGPCATLMVLKKYINEIPQGVINKRFYQACILASYIETRVSNDNNKKDKVISTISCVTDDMSNNSSVAVISSHDAGINLARAVSLDVTTESDRIISKLISKDNHHWGTSIDLDNGCCGLCSLSLGAPCLMLDSGLRSFKCGHSFHLVCLNVKQTLQNCPVCSR